MSQTYNPCCSMPCLHRGVCSPISSTLYECLCPEGYYGKSCEIRGSDLGTSYDQIFHFSRNYVLGFPQNNSFFARGLPPVPLECPTPLGIKGSRQLPNVDVIYHRLFERSEFKPCPLGTNLMFATFSQYLSYQFFKINSPYDFFFGNEKSNIPHLYNSDDFTRRALRSWKHGKLKTRIINNEEYPPYLDDVPEIFMYYPNAKGKKSAFPKWAMTHKMLGITPFTFAMATIWLREHNRVCDIILKEHPDWNDEKIYQTSRWIVLGEMMIITAGEYFQHLAQYRLKLGYKPHLVHNKMVSSSSQMQYEFSLSFQWQQMMPDLFSIQGKPYNLSDLIFSNNRIVFEHGLDAIIDLMSRTSTGQITYKNCGKAFQQVMKKLIIEGRRSRLHSFNDYRRFFDLKPYQSFIELTGNEESAKILEEIYKDIDAVEFLVGIFLEHNARSVAPPTMLSLAGPVALREILNNPISSATLWRASTFGGKTGFDIVQKATLKKLICLNLKGNCKNNVWVSFKIPSNVLALSKKINSESSNKN